MVSGRVSTSKFAVTLLPFSSHLSSLMKGSAELPRTAWGRRFVHCQRNLPTSGRAPSSTIGSRETMASPRTHAGQTRLLPGALRSGSRSPDRTGRRPWPFDGRRLLIGDRLPGQTSWSKALVRHGADPRPALAWVLGVSGDIRVKDRPSREPLAAATCEGDCLRWKIILPSRLEQFGFILGSDHRRQISADLC
jgi:hypothetical protein